VTRATGEIASLAVDPGAPGPFRHFVQQVSTRDDVSSVMLSLLPGEAGITCLDDLLLAPH